MALDKETQKLRDTYNRQFTNPSNRNLDLSSLKVDRPSRLTSEQVQSVLERGTSRRIEDETISRAGRYLEPGFDPFGNVLEQAAQEQSALEKAVKGIGRIGTKIGFEVAKMPGELYGLGEWTFTDKEFGEAVNNEWVQKLSEWEETLNETGLKVHVPESVQTGNLWDNITSTSFWATEGADGVGFLLSMFLPGQLLKGAKLGEGIAQLGKAARLIKPGEKAVAKAAGKINDFTAASVNTLFESASEGIETAKGVEELLYQKVFDERFKALEALNIYDPGEIVKVATEETEAYMRSDEAKAIAGKAGSDTFKKNLAILIGPNLLDQKWLFQGFRGAKAAESAIQRRLGTQVGKVGEEFLEDVTRLTGKQKAGRILSKGAIGIGKEGFFEEGMQFAASELDKNKAIDPENAENILDVYFDNLTNTDMQKSIFLGAVLGGGMGMIGGFNQLKQEDRYLFGQEAKEQTGIAKYLGLRDRKETKGIVNVFKDNFISRYQSATDLFEKDDSGNIRLDENNKPVLNRDKMLKYGYDILQDEVRKEQLKDLAEEGNQEAYEYIKAQRDLNYMMPFIREAGGYELLKQHINQLADKELQALQETGFYDEKTVQEVKQDLLKKADNLNKIYQKAERTVPQLFDFETKDRSEAQIWQDHLFDSYISTEYSKQFLNEQNSRYNNIISESYQGNIRTDKLVSDRQIKKGALISVGGETMIVADKKDNIIKLRTLDGKKTIDKNYSELKEEGLETVRGVSPLDRIDIKKYTELLANNNEKLEEIEESQENLITKKGQQEGFNKYLKATKEAFNKAEKAVQKKVDEEVKESTTVKEIKTKLEETETPEARKTVKKTIKNKAKEERTPTEVEEDFDINLLADQADEYYSDKPAAITDDMLNLLGDPKSTNEKEQDGTILQAVEKEIPVGSKFAEFKEAYDVADEKDEAYINFLKEVAADEFTEDETEAAIIKKTVNDYLKDLSEETRLAQETQETEYEEEIPEALEAVEGKEVTAILEKESNEYLDGKAEKGTGNITIVSHDHLFDRKGEFSDKEQGWLLSRDKDGNPVTVTIDKATEKELEKGRKLINSGKIPVGTKIRFKVDRGTPYNINKSGERRGEADFQIQVVTTYNGKEVLLGYVPIHSKDLNQNTKELRNIIWKETKNLSDYDIAYSKLESEVTKVKSGKILMFPDYTDFSKLSKEIGEHYLSAVVSINQVKQFSVGTEEEVPPTMIGNRNANIQDSGAIHVWVKHPGNGRFYPVRLFSKKLGQLDKLKQSVKDQLKNITDVDTAKNIKRDIKKDDAVLEFRYEDGIIVPYERSAGKWVRKDHNSEFDLRFRLEDIDSDPNVDRWLNNVVAKVNHAKLNTGNYNTEIADRLQGNFKSPVFSDINFEFAPPKPVEGKENKEEKQKVVNEIREEEEQKTVIPPIEEEQPKIEETDEDIDLGDDLDLNLDIDLDPDDNAPKAKVAEEGTYEQWNKVEELKWFRERFPNVPISVLNNIRETFSYDTELWGVFRNASVYIQENAAKGTAYHEAFHVVYNMYLTPAERDAMSKITSEEQLADKFADYVNGLADRTLGQKILDFFKGLWNYIQAITTGQINENLLFRRIQGSYYKTKPFTRDISTFQDSQFTRFKVAPQWNRREQTLMVRGINNYFVNNALTALRNKNPEYKDLDDVQLINEVSTDKVNGAFKIYKEIYKALKKLEPKFKGNTKYEELLKSFEYDISKGKATSGSFLSAAIRDLNNYGIKITSKDKASENEEMQESIDELGHQETWQVHQGGVNSKNIISYGVKKYIRSIPQLTKDGRFYKDPLGIFNAPVNYDTFYDTMMKDVAGEETIGDMIQVLKDLSVYHPEYNKIAADLEANKQLATEYFSAFSKPELIQVFVSEVTKGKNATSDMVLSLSNRKGIKSDILNDWVTGVETSGLMNSNTAKKFQGKVLDYHGKEFNKQTSSDFASLLAEAGLSVPGEFMYDLYDVENPKLANDTVNQFGVLLGSFVDGNNPFEGDSKENKTINTLLNRLAKTSISLTQPSFNNVKNEKVYGHQEGNYMMRFMKKLKKSDKTLTDTLEALMQDEVYRDGLPMFQELLDKKNKELLRNALEYAILDGTRYANESQGSMFPDMSPEKLNSTLLSLFANNGHSSESWFRMFTLSDAPVMPLVKYVRKSIDKNSPNNKSILDSLVQVARAEVKRIERIQKRKSLNDNLKIKHYDKDGNANFNTGFKLLPFLNGKGLENMDLTNSNSEDWIKVRNIINKALNEETNKYKKILEKQGLIKKDKDGKYQPVSGMFPGQFTKINKDIEEFIREFFYNDYFMRTQFSLVSIGDVTFYKAIDNNPVVDAQKRAKEIHSPRTLLDLTAEFEGHTIMQEYKGVLLADEEFASNSAQAIHDSLIKVGESVENAARIAASYGYSNAILVDEFNDNKTTNIAVTNPEVKEVRFEKVSGKTTPNVMGYNSKGEAIPDIGVYYKSRTVNQTDAQAYITLPFYRDTMIGAGRWNAKLENMYNRLQAGKGTAQDIKEVMQPLQPFKPFAYGIRTIQQNGETLNVPTQHKNSEYVLIPQLMKDADSKLKGLYDFMIENEVSIANFESAGKAGNYGVMKTDELSTDNIHTYDMSFRGIQQEVPEHFIDTNNLYGTQIRALIMANLVEGVDYKIGEGKEEGELVPITKQAQDLYSLYNELLVANIEESYDKLAKDFGINEKNPKIKLEKIRDLLLDEIIGRDKGEQYEKAIQIRKKTDGSYGFALPLFHPLHSKVVENLINSVFKNRITKQKINGGAFVQVTNFGFTDKLNLKFKEDGGLDHAEVMLPMWSKKLFQPYMVGNNVDVTKVEKEAPELLKGIGYRIPTEDKYSMLPFKVVGFLPLEAGGSIMLPAEITTIAGSDFDVDKMMVMLPEGKVNYDYSGVNKAIKDLHKKAVKEGKSKGLLADEFYKIQDILQKQRDEIPLVKEEEFILKVFNKLYPDGIPVKSSSKIKYDYTKSAKENTLAARNNALIDITYGILQNPNTLKDFISPGGFDTLVSLAEKLNEGKTEEELNFFSAVTQNTLAERNMTGKALVGVAANHNKNYAVRTWTNAALKTGIMFNNASLTSLSGKHNKGLDVEGTPISKNLAEFLAAIVDNAKDPVAAFINYNTYTADTMSMIVSTGHTLDTAVAFMNQKVILDMVEDFKQAPIGGEKEVMKKWAKKVGIKYDGKKLPKAANLDSQEMWDNIKSPSAEVDTKVVASFIRYKEMSKDFAKLIRAMRSDTQGGAAGPTLSDNIKAIETIESVVNPEKTKHLTGVAEIFEDNGPVPYLHAFSQNGMFAATKMLEEYFPNSRKGFKTVRKRVEENLDKDLSVKEIEHLNASLISFIYSNQSFYKVDNKEKFLQDLPNIIRLLQKNESFKSNNFAKHIKYHPKDRKSSIPYLSFDNSKNYTAEHRQTIIDGFYDLLQSEEEAKVIQTAYRNGKKVEIETIVKFSDLGKDLIRYSFFASGFNFGPNSFFQLVPVEFYTEMQEGKDLVEFTDNVLESADNELYANFLDQYYRNNYRKSNLIPPVEKDDKGKVKGFTETKRDNLMVLETTKDTPLNFRKQKGFKPFISLTVKDKVILFRYSQEDKVYIEVEKLGIPNIITEYDYSSPNLDSVIKDNKKKNEAKRSEKGYHADSKIKEKLFGQTNETNMVSMLGRIAYGEDVLAPLAEVLYEIAKEMEALGVTVPVDLMTYEEASNIFMDAGPGNFDPSSNRIIMTTDGLYRRNSENTALHETIHAMTEHFLQQDNEITRDFTRMFEYAKSKTNKPWLYGYETTSEFAAELMTNGELITDLKTINSTDTIKKYDNLFHQIIDTLLKLIGIEYGNSAYEQATSILSHVVNYGKTELYRQNIAEARKLERQHGLISPTGKTYIKGFKQSAEIAGELNKNQLKNTNFEAKRVQFVNINSFGKPVQVYGVAINPKDISTTPKVQPENTTMHETEIDIAFKLISDKEAEEHKKICNK